MQRKCVSSRHRTGDGGDHVKFEKASVALGIIAGAKRWIVAAIAVLIGVGRLNGGVLRLENEEQRPFGRCGEAGVLAHREGLHHNGGTAQHCCAPAPPGVIDHPREIRALRRRGHRALQIGRGMKRQRQ